MTYQVVAVVRGNFSDHQIFSPRFATLDEAETELAEIRKAQESGLSHPGSATLTDRPWLSVDGRIILAAHVVQSGR